MCNIRIFCQLKYVCNYGIIQSEVRERNLTAGIRKEVGNVEPMTNEQSKRLEELIRENEKLKRKVKKLKKQLKNK